MQGLATTITIYEEFVACTPYKAQLITLWFGRSKLESDVCCRLQVAPPGESYEGKRRPGRKQWQTTAGYMA